MKLEQVEAWLNLGLNAEINIHKVDEANIKEFQRYYGVEADCTDFFDMIEIKRYDMTVRLYTNPKTL